MVVTDAPLDAPGAARLAARIGLGLGRVGSSASHGSGEIFLGLATGLPGAPRRLGPRRRRWPVATWTRSSMPPWMPTEEAVLSSLLAAETTTGRRGLTVPALPDEVWSAAHVSRTGRRGWRTERWPDRCVGRGRGAGAGCGDVDSLPVMARRPAGARRDEILEATVDQIVTRGLAGVRVADVARALGISTGLVFYHFDTKERLVADAFAYAAQRDLARVDRVVAASGDPAQRLAKVLTIYAPTGPTTSWPVWIEAWAAAIAEPEIRSTWRRLDAHWKAAVTSVIEEGVASGAFRCDDPVAAAWRISALTDGLAVQAVVNRTALRRDTLLAWVRRAAALEVGLAPDALD